MKRREFITLLGGAAIAWPLVTRAQQPGLQRVGVLMGLAESDSEGQKWTQTFLQALQELGWKRDSNVQIDLRWASDVEQMRISARELVSRRPDVIHVTTTPATAAILQETATIPVVFSAVSDPVGSGFVQGLSRPGGNATGFINIESSIGGKWVGLLKEVAPRVARVATLFNAATAPQAAYYSGPLEAAAASRAIAVRAAPVRDGAEIETTIETLGRDSNAGLVVLPDVTTATYRDLIISLAARYRVPAVYPFSFFVRAGGLISYGVHLLDLQRGAANYVDRILKGAKPADLPVQLPTRFELAVNLKTAQMLGLGVPPTLLAVADEVIE